MTCRCLSGLGLVAHPRDRPSGVFPPMISSSASDQGTRLLEGPQKPPQDARRACRRGESYNQKKGIGRRVIGGLRVHPRWSGLATRSSLPPMRELSPGRTRAGGANQDVDVRAPGGRMCIEVNRSGGTDGLCRAPHFLDLATRARRWSRRTP